LYCKLLSIGVYEVHSVKHSTENPKRILDKGEGKGRVEGVHRNLIGPTCPQGEGERIKKAALTKVS
jgi:hypothetical protein